MRMRRVPKILTFDDQPDNLGAWRIGEACRKAARSPGGDYIDGGLGLLKELQAKGYGIVALTPAAPEQAEQQYLGMDMGHADGSAMVVWNATAAIQDVVGERQRQISAERWTPEHDDKHPVGDMARAAACYALVSANYPADDVAILRFWPWLDGWWKPGENRRNLIKAGALILAEIERIDRAAQQQEVGRG